MVDYYLHIIDSVRPNHAGVLFYPTAIFGFRSKQRYYSRYLQHNSHTSFCAHRSYNPKFSKVIQRAKKQDLWI